MDRRFPADLEGVQGLLLDVSYGWHYARIEVFFSGGQVHQNRPQIGQVSIHRRQEWTGKNGQTGNDLPAWACFGGAEREGSRAQ
jgi:hypothetical protein